MLVGYMRVSKSDGSQNTDLQRDALLKAGVTENQLYEDITSGKREDRPGLMNCLKALRKGDTLIVWKLDRLGRDLRAQGEIIKEDDEARLSPLGRKHINFLGHFSFMLPKVVSEGQLRPLNLVKNPELS